MEKSLMIAVDQQTPPTDEEVREFLMLIGKISNTPKQKGKSNG